MDLRAWMCWLGHDNMYVVYFPMIGLWKSEKQLCLTKKKTLTKVKSGSYCMDVCLAHDDNMYAMYFPMIDYERDKLKNLKHEQQLPKDRWTRHARWSSSRSKSSYVWPIFLLLPKSKLDLSALMHCLGHDNNIYAIWCRYEHRNIRKHAAVTSPQNLIFKVVRMKIYSSQCVDLVKRIKFPSCSIFKFKVIEGFDF